MSGLTPPKKPSNSKMRRKALKCTVELEIQAITCPGVVLPAQQDLYLSVCIMGQYQKTHCVPPVFPLLLQRKMLFVKTFTGVADPGDIADVLEHDTTSFELIQLVPPEGDVLATVEETTREFLYPGPRLTPKAPGPDRELLMRRSVSFPGISPKVEFSTTSIIEECDVRDSQAAISAPARPRRARGSSGRGASRKQTAAPPCGYARPTVASLTRAPSPYTHRRMCQLSEDARQRLAHLQLGPHTFRKQTVPQPPFVVPRSPSASLMESPPSRALSSSPSSSSPPKRSSPPRRSGGCAAQLSESSLLGSYRPNPTKVPEGSLHTRAVPHARRSAGERNARAPGSPAPAPASGAQRSQRPPPARTPTPESRPVSPSGPGGWEDIHGRVQWALQMYSTPAPARHPCDETLKAGESSGSEPRAINRNSQSGGGQSLLRSAQEEPSAHFDSGTFWASRSAKHTGTPRRAVFEDSLGQIYKNLYRQASTS